MSDTSLKVANPRTFISYCWSSPSHQEWVLALATQLREDGVDVVLDKWDLKEGHDALAFMEKMISDAIVTKVIMILDKMYAEKADGRQGGVGTETQIISAEVYGKSDQNKFCAVLSEVDSEGRPYLPIYYRSRIYVDLSNEDVYATNYDQLLRWIFNKPAYPKPSLGRPPSFVTDKDSPVLPVSAKFRRAIDALKQNSANSIAFLRDYLDTLSSSFEDLRITQANDPTFDDRVVQSMEAFLPYRNEFIEVITILARSNIGESHIEAIHRFFERVAPFLTMPPKQSPGWGSWDFDNFRFIVSELFLYVVSVLLRYERFPLAATLTNTKYYLEDAMRFGKEPMQHFGVLWEETESLDRRNIRLGLKKASLRADLLEQRSHSSGLDFRYLMQGDFTLFLRDSHLALRRDGYQQWWPATMVYGRTLRAPFEIYARAESQRYFDKLKVMFEIQSKEELEPLIEAFNANRYGLPSWDYMTLNPVLIMNYQKLASLP
jgi:hypothetical protein